MAQQRDDVGEEFFDCTLGQGAIGNLGREHCLGQGGQRDGVGGVREQGACERVSADGIQQIVGRRFEQGSEYRFDDGLDILALLPERGDLSVRSGDSQADGLQAFVPCRAGAMSCPVFGA
ncbi:hypothetical protein [Arthrobacter citreus]|uniref:hypothetical protein n=1 Tax=Arthrobacter citreus TaxID=1670 RepID=UPI0031F90960